jgi:hypothetical protein
MPVRITCVAAKVQQELRRVNRDPLEQRSEILRERCVIPAIVIRVVNSGLIDHQDIARMKQLSDNGPIALEIV